MSALYSTTLYIQKTRTKFFRKGGLGEMTENKAQKITQRKPSRKLQNELKEIEITKWNKLFRDISSDKKEVADRLIEEAAFMKITLDILKVRIQLDGP